jgi:hypothetical protein
MKKFSCKEEKNHGFRFWKKGTNRTAGNFPLYLTYNSKPARGQNDNMEE